MAETEGLRERTRRVVRTDIASTAMELFLEHGFDAVTMDQIAQQAGVSRRSLFRYFGTKEDLVLGDLAEMGRESARALRARPEHEPPWTALRQAFDVVVHSAAYSPERAFKIYKMVRGTPALRARRLEKQLTWLDIMVPEIRRRLTGDDADLRARAIVSSALACLDTATETWIKRNGKGRIEQLYDEAVAAVRGSD